MADRQTGYGEHKYRRIGLHIPEEVKDGARFYLDDAEVKTKPSAAETWLLLRASGTEPLMLIYT